MSLPSSGPIALSDVNIELGRSASALIGLDDADVRTLFGKGSGEIKLSDGYGKSSLPTLSLLNISTFGGANVQTHANAATLVGEGYLSYAHFSWGGNTLSCQNVRRQTTGFQSSGWAYQNATAYSNGGSGKYPSHNRVRVASAPGHISTDSYVLWETRAGTTGIHLGRMTLAASGSFVNTAYAAAAVVPTSVIFSGGAVGHAEISVSSTPTVCVTYPAATGLGRTLRTATLGASVSAAVITATPFNTHKYVVAATARQVNHFHLATTQAGDSVAVAIIQSSGAVSNVANSPIAVPGGDAIIYDCGGAAVLYGSNIYFVVATTGGLKILVLAAAGGEVVGWKPSISSFDAILHMNYRVSATIIPGTNICIVGHKNHVAFVRLVPDTSACEVLIPPTPLPHPSGVSSAKAAMWNITGIGCSEFVGSELRVQIFGTYMDGSTEYGVFAYGLTHNWSAL